MAFSDGGLTCYVIVNRTQLGLCILIGVRITSPMFIIVLMHVCIYFTRALSDFCVSDNQVGIKSKIQQYLLHISLTC